MPKPEAEHMLEHTCRSRLAYTELSRRAIGAGVRVWLFVAKHHYWWHMAWVARFGTNPRTAWCFKDEDYMGRIAAVVHVCVGGGLSMGPPPAEIVSKVSRWQTDAVCGAMVAERSDLTRFASPLAPTEHWRTDIMISSTKC